jgi:DNA mismatch endonuclease (patch repair protein)
MRFKAEDGFITTIERSNHMRKIRSLNTKPELELRKLLWSKGLRYRINYKKLPGKPDIVFTKYKLAVFIDGEFWHGYNWGKKKEKIKANRDYWIPKIERNIQRDIENKIELEKLGFKVIRFWEAQIKKEADICYQIILEQINIRGNVISNRSKADQFLQVNLPSKI